jgi:hypothetical protein
MKKYLASLLVVCMIFPGVAAISTAVIPPQTKNSIYVQNLTPNSWIKTEMSTSLTPLGCELNGNWHEKVTVCREFVDSEPSSDETNVYKNFKKNKEFNILVPLKEEEDGPVVGSFRIELKEATTEFDTILTSVAKPENVVGLTFLNTISDFPYEKELSLIDQVGKEVSAVFDNARLIRVSMGTYTWGYVLVLETNKDFAHSWFWCLRGVGKYKEHQFYKLPEFLKSYWEDVKTQNEMHRRYC